MFVKNSKIYKVEHIYNHIKDCLENKQSFSICRMGNAEVATINIREMTHLRGITQGIPEDKINELLSILLISANNCDYVASMGAWLTEEYFDIMPIKPTSIYRNWEQIFKDLGIINTNYCNPDIGYHLFLEGDNNLWNIIKDKHICLLTSKENVVDNMRKAGINCDLISIPPQTTRQEYTKDMKIPLCGYWHWDEYNKINDFLTEYHANYDIFLIGAGYLAKGYSDHIKKLGGISIDVGKVMNTWNGEGMGRIAKWMEESDDFSFKLTDKGKEYNGKY